MTAGPTFNMAPPTQWAKPPRLCTSYPYGNPPSPESEGFFETLLLEDGKPLYLDRHLARAEKAWRDFMVDGGTPIFDVADFKQRIVDALHQHFAEHAEHLLQRCRLRILFYPRARRCAEKLQIEVSPWQFDDPSAVELLSHRETDGLRSRPRHIKDLRRQPYQELRVWAQARGAFDSLILGQGDEIQETTVANIFFVAEPDRLVTPPLGNLIPGVVRQLLMDRGPICIVEQAMKLSDISFFSGAFLTNSLFRVLPVRRIDEHEFSLATGWTATAIARVKMFLNRES